MSVFKGSLYILNLLCGILPCEYKYAYPDTSTTEPQTFNERVSVDYEADQLELKGGGWWKDGKYELYKDIDYNKTHPLIVYTSTGKIRGYWMRAVGGRKVRAFEGIPYAESPVYENRFKSPVPVKPWAGLLQATLKGPKCLQYNDIALLRVVGSENCLYLNIYTRKPSASKNVTRLYPVIVYIHGGGFLTGSGNDFGPAYLLTRDLVLVTVNYRLGVMGFMSTGDNVSPGNYGLKDQAEAIKWVHTNIEHFMGDPKRITLMGHGAGGSSVHFHMMSFRARGMFVAGISISGTAFNQWALHTQDQAVNLTKSFAKSFHCPVHGSNEDIVACIRKHRGYDLVKRQVAFLDKWPVPLSLFRPVVEEEYQGQSFLTVHPEEAYKKGMVDKIPWICGLAEDEAYTFLLPHVALGTFGDLRRKWNHLAPDFLNYNDLPVDQDEITRRVNWLYFRHVNPQTAPLKIFSDALGARTVHTGIHKALQAHSQYADAYGFMFGYNGKYNLATAAGIKPAEWAVGHGEILGYILNSTNMYTGFQKTDSELVLSKIIVNLIYNFAEKQFPSYTTQDGEEFHLWDRITDPRNMSFLHIDKKIKMIPEPYLQQTLYWESLGLPDGLPLANHSSEIENITDKDPDSKGFVSTDITRSTSGISIPPELRPPSENFTENLFVLYSNVSFDNATEVKNGSASNATFTNSGDISIITFTTSTEPPLPTLTSPPVRTALPTVPPSPSEGTTTTESLFDKLRTTTRWLAQDFHLPNLTVAKRQESTTTPTPRTTIAPPVRRPNQSILTNLLDTIVFQNPLLVGPLENSGRGVSVPVVGGPDPHQNFVTRSNLNLTNEYLKSLGLAGFERESNSFESNHVGEIETMMMDSNSNHIVKEPKI